MNKFDFLNDFDQAFKTKSMTDFDTWFCQMAEKVWGLDFEKIKPGGKHGDKKSDGRLISLERVFQCYAPESPSTFAKNAPAKIQDSFPAVIEYWPNLKEWVFVHNNDAGIPTTVSDVLEQLRSDYPSIKIHEGSRNFIKTELHDHLSSQDLIDLYPHSLAITYSSVQMDHVRPLLRKLLAKAEAQPDPFYFGSDPDEEKLDFNKLSSAAKRDLRAALTKVGIVDRYLKSNAPGANAVLQAEMISKYKELKGFGHPPDDIIAMMLKWVGDDGSPTVRHAAYVIIAYYFDACDIFENVPVQVQ